MLTSADRLLEELRSRRDDLLPRGLWRRRGDPALSTLSGGIRLALFTSPFIVRWATWLVALLIVLITDLPESSERFEPYLLIATFAQTLVVTFYVPAIRPVVLPALKRDARGADNVDVLALGLLDIALSMMAVYLSGGWRSPYFHFALTALLIPSFFLTFRGVMLLAAAYTAAYVAGVATFGDGLDGSWRDSNLNSFIGAIVTPLLIALVPNYLGTLLREIELSREDAVGALADNELLYGVARAFLEGGGDAGLALARVASAASHASPFDALLLLVPDDRGGTQTRAYGHPLPSPPPQPEALAAAFAGDDARSVRAATLPPPLERAFDGFAWVGVVPLRSVDAVEGWLIAATRERRHAALREMRLLKAVASQIGIGVRNIRLATRIGELAAESERTRIAREIHDGIAQMVYMLSLSLETAVERAGGDTEEQRKRLRDLTVLAKNALWEVRQYIFDLRPLLSGDEGLVRAIEGQVKEFEAVSGLPVMLTVAGEPASLPVTASAALYRIVQEGLGNIFRHARASRAEVALTFAHGALTLSVADDGVGIGEAAEGGRVGHGMDNLRRRVEELRGTVDIHSEPGAGTRIEVIVPTGGEP